MNDFPTGDHSGTAAQPAKDNPPPPNSTEHRKSNTYRQARKALPFIEAACAIALVFITGFYTYYAKKQAKAATDAANAANSAAQIANATLGEIQKGGTDTHELAVQAKNQADATKTVAERTLVQAKATSAVVTASQESMRLDQRAWVGASDVDATIGPDKQIVVTVKFKNTGKTPAVDARMNGKLRPFKNITMPDFTLDRKNSQPKGVIQPGATVSGTARGWTVTKDGFEDIVSGRTVVYMFGKMDYRDVFGCAHWTEYCFVFSPIEDRSGMDIQECRGHNEVDKNNCPQPKAH